MEKQIQKSGDNSQLLQAGTINIYNGIDEERVRKICAETYAIARRDFTADAYACANARVQKFEDSLLPKIQKIDGAIEAFSDPSFQFLLTKSQKAAAATERDMDYEMLSELLVYRITKGQTKKNRAGINRAADVIAQIDDDALCALTVVHAVNHLTTTLGSCKQGLACLANLFEKLMYMELPLGSDWIEHLDILDTIRISQIGNFKKFSDFYPEMLPGYSCAGICINSETHAKAIKILNDIGLNSSFLVQNDVIKGYVKLPVVRKEEIKNITKVQKSADGSEVIINYSCVNEQEISALENIWDMYSKDIEANNLAKSNFVSMWDNYTVLKRLHEWWDSIPLAFNITHIGSVLACINARRCDDSLPELPMRSEL